MRLLLKARSWFFNKGNFASELNADFDNYQIGEAIYNQRSIIQSMFSIHDRKNYQ